MNTNRFLSVLFAFCIVISAFSCSSDDEMGSEYPKVVNVKFEVTTSSNVFGNVTTTINNESESDVTSSFPYSKAVTQLEVEQGTYLKLTFEDESLCPNGNNCDFDTELSILVDDVIVQSDMFRIMQGQSVVRIDYTFN